MEDDDCCVVVFLTAWVSSTSDQINLAVGLESINIGTERLCDESRKQVCVSRSLGNESNRSSWREKLQLNM